MNFVNTGVSADSVAWAPSVTALPTTEALPQLLISQITEVINTEMLSDAAAVVLPVLRPSEAQVVAEGAAIPETEHQFSEVTVFTHAVANLSVLSIELQAQMKGEVLAQNMGAALVRKSNDLLLNTATTGLVAAAQDGGSITTSLDALSDASWDANADYVVLSRGAGKALSTIKEAADSARPLIENLTGLLGLDVYVSDSLTGNSVLVGRKNAVVSSLTPLEIAKSEHYAFARRAVATRGAFRQGWAVSDASGLVLVTVGA